MRGHPQRLAHVLLHQQHGQPGSQDLRQHAVDPLHDHRREAQGQLVEQQHPRVGHQRPADGHRLLLAAGQLRGPLGPPVPHPGEQLVDPLDRPRALPRVGRADLQVLLDRERPEQPPAFRHHDDPAGGPALGPDLGHVGAVEQDRALGRAVQAGDRAQQRRLARPVGADDRVHLAREHPQRDVVQGPQLAMVHGQLADLQYRARPLASGALSTRRSFPRRSFLAPSVQSAPRPFGSRQSLPGFLRVDVRGQGAAGQGGGDLGAEEDLADRRVGQHLGRVAVADELPAGQADQPSHHGHQRAHHVLDPDHRDALGVHPADDLHQLRDFRVGQAAGHLVEQQQLRPRRERAGEFQPLALQQAEPLGGQVRLAGHAGPLERLGGRRVAGPPPQPGALLGGDQHVLEHGHVRKRPRYLVGAADAEPAPGRRVQPGDRAPGEGDVPGPRGQVTGDEAEQAGLAGSVRPHDPNRVPGARP